MTIEQIQAAVSDIAAIIARRNADPTDESTAHELEDELHQAVLRAIAAGSCADPAACAREALKSLDIDFTRWTE